MTCKWSCQCFGLKEFGKMSIFNCFRKFSILSTVSHMFRPFFVELDDLSWIICNGWIIWIKILLIFTTETVYFSFCELTWKWHRGDGDQYRPSQELWIHSLVWKLKSYQLLNYIAKVGSDNCIFRLQNTNTFSLMTFFPHSQVKPVPIHALLRGVIVLW